MENKIENELKHILDIFKQAYIQRDCEKIDSFMEFAYFLCPS